MDYEREHRILVRCLIACFILMMLGPTIKLFAGLAYYFGWF